MAVPTSPPTTGHYVSDTRAFLDMLVTKLEWMDLSDDVVMDIGCGNPKLKFCELLVQRFPNVQKVIAVDNRTHLINYINCRRSIPQIEYHYADIENRSTLHNWEGKIAKLVSSHCFHQLQDQTTAFQNVYHLLKPGGEAAILFCLQSGFVSWHTELSDNHKWNKFYNGNGPVKPLTQSANVHSDQFHSLLESNGFSVVLCQKDKICVPFDSDKGWKESTLNLGLSAFDIPESSLEEFKKDLYETFMKYNGRNENGQPCQFSHFLTVLLRKPAS